MVTFETMSASLKLAIDTLQSKSGPTLFLRYTAARVILERSEEMYDWYPEDATEILTEAERIMRLQAAREYHTPHPALLAWIADLVDAMRNGISIDKENAARRLCQIEALVREFRPGDAQEIILEAVRVTHAAAVEEAHRRGIKIPAQLLQVAPAQPSSSPKR